MAARISRFSRCFIRYGQNTQGLQCLKANIVSIMVLLLFSTLMWDFRDLFSHILKFI